MGTDKVSNGRKTHVQLNVRITPEMSVALDRYCEQHAANGKPMAVQLLVTQALAQYIGQPDLVQA